MQHKRTLELQRQATGRYLLAVSSYRIVDAWRKPREGCTRPASFPGSWLTTFFNFFFPFSGLIDALEALPPFGPFKVAAGWLVRAVGLSGSPKSASRRNRIHPEPGIVGWRQIHGPQFSLPIRQAFDQWLGRSWPAKAKR